MAEVDPILGFREAIRPATLLVQVFQLLDSAEGPSHQHALLGQIRALLASASEEELLLIQNDLFLGIVREKAPVKKAQLRTESLAHLLRQAIVASATAYETYLGNLLRTHLPRVIELRGRDFFPIGDGKLVEQFAGLKFELGDVLRLLNEPPDSIATFLGNKLTAHVSGSFLGKTQGVTMVGRLLGLANPWDNLAASLGRDPKELEKYVRLALQRRNDIVHRGDRSQDKPEVIQEMKYPYAAQSVDSIRHTCEALDDLVKAKLREFASAPREVA